MKKVTSAVLEKFNAAYESEVGEISKAYYRSLEIYEKSMRDFILKYIARDGDFESRKKFAFDVVYQNLDKDWITEVNLYEEIIEDSLIWLEEEASNEI